MPKSCSIDGCPKDVVARGFCGMHYRRWRLYGDPGSFAPPKARPTPHERFWRHVERGVPDECWEWAGNRNVGGYGLFRLSGKNRGAHRASWIFANGEIPGDLFVLHRCDNPPCVNPAHLFLGTAADNARDREEKGRGGAQKRTGPRPGQRKNRKCSINSCDEKHLARGFCRKHYRQAQADSVVVIPCSIEGCGDAVIARGWCGRHYTRWREHGDPTIVQAPRRPRAQVTDKMRERMHELAAEGVPHREIASRVGVSPRSVGGIVRRISARSTRP